MIQKKNLVTVITILSILTSNTKMTTLTEDILRGGNQPPENFFVDFLIEGTSESVESKLKEEGWDGKSPRASIIIHFDS